MYTTPNLKLGNEHVKHDVLGNANMRSLFLRRDVLESPYRIDTAAKETHFHYLPFTFVCLNMFEPSSNALPPPSLGAQRPGQRCLGTPHLALCPQHPGRGQ